MPENEEQRGAGREVVVAPATAAGRGALAVVRLTGAPLLDVLDRVVKPRHPGPWQARRVRRVDVWSGTQRIDDGLAVLFRAPRSYTGDDLCELSVHANPRIVEQVLAAFVDAGARLAQPGELTRRAVLSGKLDLVQAEAVDALIRATGARGIDLAQQQLAGQLSAVFSSMSADLVGIAAELEAKLDWPGDDLAFQSDEMLASQLEGLSIRALALADSYRSGKILVDGAKVALIGPVNAGKSSLFNRLLGQERAIVHPTPGTTRDVVEARMLLGDRGDIEVTLLDTAGERSHDAHILDPIEEIGLARGRARAEDVDLVLVIVPADASSDPAIDSLLARVSDRPHLVVFNRMDLPDAKEPPNGAIGVSALTGAGLVALRERINIALLEGGGADLALSGVMLSSIRQRDRLLAVANATAEAARALPLAGAAVAADLVTEAMEELDTTRGTSVREAVLDEVFRRFCIGK